jgi:hypothetical protein
VHGQTHVCDERESNGAIELHWQTLESWWLAGHDRAFTSVSFLIDRHGVIRHIHPGGKYVKGDGSRTHQGVWCAPVQVHRLAADSGTGPERLSEKSTDGAQEIARSTPTPWANTTRRLRGRLNSVKRSSESVPGIAAIRASSATRSIEHAISVHSKASSIFGIHHGELARCVQRLHG